MFEIVIASSAKKHIKRISKTQQKRIKSAIIQKLAPDPSIVSQKTKNPNLPEFKFRVGDYRVLFDMDTKSKKIHILTIKHRSEVYE